MEKLAKIVRVATVAPIMALVAVVIIFLMFPSSVGGAIDLACAIVFLTVLPLLAYPLQKYIPKFKDRGREGQRSLAMIFAVVGYILGCIVNIFLVSPTGMWVIYLEYLLSGVAIFVFNKCFHLKASGHACGVTGPVALLVYFGVPAVIPGLLLLALIWWASLKSGRHTVKQLVGGTIIPLAVLAAIGAVLLLAGVKALG